MPKQIVAYRVNREEVVHKRSCGMSYESAVKAVVGQVIVSEGEPAFDSLELGMLAVVNGTIYGTSIQHILGD